MFRLLTCYDEPCLKHLLQDWFLPWGSGAQGPELPRAGIMFTSCVASLTSG